NLMHQRAKVVYFTEEEIQWRPNVLDNVRSDGYEPIVVTEQQKTKLEQQMHSGGPQVRTVEEYVEEYNQSFQYEFVHPRQLTRSERRVYDRTFQIFALVGVRRSRCPDVRISETMRVTNDDTGGVWDPSIPAIVIKRVRLTSLVGYAATLLHELGHAITGRVDATREFEQVLTTYLGQTGAAAIKR
ncbi:ATP-binding protein, partial [Candidatus Bipolaricaulota bacterium]|nr:ATP-binding protein [Candidatus Bipolaricaulota bacterium]